MLGRAIGRTTLTRSVGAAGAAAVTAALFVLPAGPVAALRPAPGQGDVGPPASSSTTDTSTSSTSETTSTTAATTSTTQQSTTTTTTTTSTTSTTQPTTTTTRPTTTTTQGTTTTTRPTTTSTTRPTTTTTTTRPTTTTSTIRSTTTTRFSLPTTTEASTTTTTTTTSTTASTTTTVGIASLPPLTIAPTTTLVFSPTLTAEPPAAADDDSPVGPTNPQPTAAPTDGVSAAVPSEAGTTEATEGLAPSGESPETTDGLASAGAPPAESSPPPAATSVRQGQALTFAVPPDCTDPQFGTLDPANKVIVDADVNPVTFTVQTSDLELGSYLLNVECQNGLTVQSDMMVFRQNGAKRGGAASVLTAGSLGLGSAVALVGLPGSLGGNRRRRPVLNPSSPIHPRSTP